MGSHVKYRIGSMFCEVRYNKIIAVIKQRIRARDLNPGRRGRNGLLLWRKGRRMVGAEQRRRRMIYARLCCGNLPK